MSQEPFCVKIYRKNAARPRAHLDQTPAPNCDHKNPFNVATLSGEKNTFYLVSLPESSPLEVALNDRFVLTHFRFFLTS